MTDSTKAQVDHLLRHGPMSTEQRLRRFIANVKDGTPPEPADLWMLADWAESYLAGEWQKKPEKRKRGKPAGKLSGEKQWGLAAGVQFHRFLLPKYLGTEAMTQEEIGTRIHKDATTVRRLENAHPLAYPNDENSGAFYEVMSALISSHGLPVGTWYCHLTNSLRGPIAKHNRRDIQE